MSTPTFTPGPWKAERQTQMVFHVESEDFGRIVTVHEPTQPKIAKANAHLIASAPDLYAALDYLAGEVRACLGISEPEIRAAVGNTNMACLTQRVEQAIAALAKARGEK